MDEEKNIDTVASNELSEIKNPSDSLYNFASSLNVTDTIFRANCLLCNSKFRKDAEEIYSVSNNCAKVHRFLKDKGELISYPAVTQHIRKHFLNIIANARIQEYAESLREFSDLRQTRIEKMKNHIAMLERRIIMIESNTDEDDIDSQRKTGETVVKLMDKIHDWEEKLTIINNEKEPVRILLTNFDNIVKVKVDNITSPEARIVIEEILEEFIRSAEELDYQ